PSNDDAIRAIKLIVSKMADAALEGTAVLKETVEEEITDYDEYGRESFDGMEDADDEVLLGESTLAKLREAEGEAEAEAEAKEAVEEEAVTGADEEESE
ncbi:MAG: hypothetical protein ACE5FD_11360, partial [Anaerolineae bacterium]